jgi:multiple antibiotic resistance protein
MTTWQAATALFLVMDPLGNIPLFLAQLRPLAAERRRIVLVRELLLAYVALVAFLFGGRHLVSFLHLRQEAISIAGGIILFLIALRMVFPNLGSGEGHADAGGGEPLVVPLAIPGIAGPSCLAMVLLLMHSHPDRQLDWWLAITTAWGGTALILLAAPLLHRLIKERGLVAMERLMGMLLVTVAVQMFLDGLEQSLRG